MDVRVRINLQDVTLRGHTMSNVTTKKSSKPGVASFLELIARAGAVLLALVYGSGFLIISLRHAAFGIAQYSFFAPRILSAGILFVFLIIVPTVAASRIFPEDSEHDKDVAPEVLWCRRTEAVLSLAITSVVLAFVASFLFKSEQPVPFHGFVLCGTTLLFATVARRVVRKRTESPVRGAILSLSAFAALTASTLTHPQSHFAVISGWFFLVGFATPDVLLRKLMREPQTLKYLQWETWAFLALFALSSYSILIYGSVKPEYGGGSTRPITLFLSQRIPVMASLSSQVHLIDENENGYYVLPTPESKRAIFVPRRVVAAIRFGSEEQAARVK